MTVECPDVKSFQNVVLTVYAKDPGIKYKTTTKDALSREVKLIKKMVIHHMKHTGKSAFVLFYNVSFSFDLHRPLNHMH